MALSPRHIIPAIIAAFALTSCSGEFSFEVTPSDEQQKLREENRQSVVDDSLGISITHTKLPSYEKRNTTAELMCVDDIAYLNIVVKQKDTGLGATTTRTPELDEHCPIVDEDATIESDEVTDVTDDATADTDEQDTTEQDTTDQDDTAHSTASKS